MKKLTILFVLFSFSSFSQIYDIDQTDLYKKYKIKEVKQYYKSKNTETWKIDTNGIVIFQDRISREDSNKRELVFKNEFNYENGLLVFETEIRRRFDTNSLDTNIYQYFYKDKLLVQKIIINRDIETNVLDTSDVKYFYNHKNKLIMDIVINSKSKDTSYTYYEYCNDLLMKETCFNKKGEREYIDSNEYHFNDSLKAFYIIFYENNKLDSKFVEYYNLRGVEQYYLEYNYVNYKWKQFISESYFFNDKNQLIGVKGIVFIKTEEEHQLMDDTFFEYDKKGLEIIEFIPISINKYLKLKPLI